MKDTNSEGRRRTPTGRPGGGTRRGRGPAQNAAHEGPIGQPAPADNGQAGEALPDSSELSRQIAGIAEKSQRLVAEFLERETPKDGGGIASALGIGAAFLEMTSRMMADPSRL